MKKFFLIAILLLAGSDAFAQETERPQYVISVTHRGQALGNITIELFPDVAPKHVRNFDSLVSVKFYDGTVFHRVVEGFVIQGGGMRSKDTVANPRERWGASDPSQTRVPAEFNKLKHERGIISAARTKDPNSATSQFFIVLDDAPSLDGNYTVYGRVLSGMDVVDAIVELPQDEHNNPIDRVEMKIVKK